ncbi:355_t:CDS:2, partial [Entrophospora sp. SA101]
ILASPHCHHLEKIKDREKLASDYLRLSNKEIDQIKNINSIYQIALDEKDKFRVYGIKRKFREEDYFEILLFDPNHLFHLNKKKGKYPYGGEAERAARKKVEE